MSGYVRYTPATPGREKTPNLWGKALEAYAVDPAVGIYRFDDFTDKFLANTTDASANSNWFIQDAAAGGTSENFTSIDGVDGLVTLSATTGTDHFGIEAHYGSTATTQGIINLCTHSTDERGDVIVEFYIKIDDCDQWFVGLTEPIVEFLGATGALPTSSDYIGFYRSDAGALTFVAANDNNGGTAVADSVTLLTAAQTTTLQAAGYMKLGFKVKRDQKVSVYVENESYQVAIDAGFNKLALPIETLTYKIALQRGPTADNATVAATLDWVGSFVEAL